MGQINTQSQKDKFQEKPLIVTVIFDTPKTELNLKMKKTVRFLSKQNHVSSLTGNLFQTIALCFDI